MSLPSKNNPFGEPRDVDWEGASTIEIRSADEVKIPEHVYPFKPRPYQKKVIDKMLDNYRADQTVQLITGRNGRTRYIGVDMAEKGGDHSVITHAKINGSGKITKIWFDEYADWPTYKWWRNPIKKWKLNRLMRKIKWPK